MGRVGELRMCPRTSGCLDSRLEHRGMRLIRRTTERQTQVIILNLQLQLLERRLNGIKTEQNETIVIWAAGQARATPGENEIDRCLFDFPKEGSAVLDNLFRPKPLELGLKGMQSLRGRIFENYVVDTKFEHTDRWHDRSSMRSRLCGLACSM